MDDVVNAKRNAVIPEYQIAWWSEIRMSLRVAGGNRALGIDKTPLVKHAQTCSR